MKLGRLSAVVAFFVLVSSAWGLSEAQVFGEPLPGLPDKEVLGEARCMVWLQSFENKAGQEGQSLPDALVQALESAPDRLALIRPHGAAGVGIAGPRLDIGHFGLTSGPSRTR